MEITFLLLKLIPLLLVCCMGPGLLAMARVRCSPIERLCGVFAVSFISIYLASFAIFCLNLGVWAYWITSALFGVMGLAGWRTARLLFRRRLSRSAVLCFCVILGWRFLHLAMVLHFDGGNWSGDWHEQMERTTYFLHLLPNNTLFSNRHPLPARPPMMNLIAAFVCRQVGHEFASFSLIYLVLNGWAYLRCCLFLRNVAPRGRAALPALAILFMLNPSISENATLTVTKAFTAGLV